MKGVIFWGVVIPFIGTSLGACFVFFLKKGLSEKVNRALTGFAAGVMTAASFWSLLAPALDFSEALGRWAFLPSFIGFWIGVFFLLILDHAIPHLHQMTTEPEGPVTKLDKTFLMLLAVTIHNIPEGMAIGVVYASYASGNSFISLSAALALSLGIAIQNVPEGAIISMPLYEWGWSMAKASGYGILSGIVEPIGAVLTIYFATQIIPLMPYFLSFAAGAMLYVVVEELIPEMSQGRHSDIGVLSFSLGFSVMMVLDVALS
ncbi:MAG: ZIP family metal transporter [Acidaminococcus sp.]|uniref:ZIP family metal transporter n=1 Tax=Acidaminococcus intestini TaxID=187327 RepID=A0A943EJ42_9FIRM|nr:ZIP family metal transporter [Acidaminococcus sp.]MBS5519225.1 ZIP family metal transporter [Acidaminococcus intestini]MDY2739845.1 ZIP family metal transporter [Acidaminococcus sp.]